MRNVYDDPANAEVRKTLHAELTRLRTELKVPEQDPEPAKANPGAKGKGKVKGKKKAAKNAE
jgi:hypothetical protein